MLVTTTGYLYLTIDVAPFYLQQKNLTLLVDSTTYHHVTADDNGSGLPIPTVHLSNLALKSVLCVSSVQRNEIFVLSFSNHAPIGNFPSSFAVKDLSTVEEVLQDKKQDAVQKWPTSRSFDFLTTQISLMLTTVVLTIHRLLFKQNQLGLTPSWCLCLIWIGALVTLKKSTKCPFEIQFQSVMLQPPLDLIVSDDCDLL